MATARDIKSQISNELRGIYSTNEISSLSKALFSHILDYSSTQYLLNDDIQITTTNIKIFEEAIKRLTKHEPIQHITGSCEFYGLPFSVNKDVLIPRPETEELISWIKESDVIFNTILDICTGSGCIAIALKSVFNNAEIHGWDISTSALTTAKENSIKNRLPVDFDTINILEYIPDPNKKFDLIVSNPPYIRENEKCLMHSNVLNFEPHIALFVEDTNPLKFYTKIAAIAQIQLNKNGLLFFEINEAFGKETIEMLGSFGFTEINLKQDINGKDRMISARKL